VNCRWRYTIDDIITVKTLYLGHTAAEIATRIYGTPRAAKAIWILARAIGLRKWPCWTPGVIRRVRRLHARGLNDVEIAAEMGLTRNQVHAIRYGRLKLPPNEASILRARRRGVKTQLKTLGLDSPTQLRTRAFRMYAVESGWPEDLRPREVQILNVLAAKGVPMTRRELAAAIGMKSDPADYCRGQRNLLSGNGPGGTYTASLARRGLVTILARLGPTCGAQGKGAGRRISLYMLGPVALQILEEASKCQKTENAAR
jgi:hypothetical protein